MSARPERSAPHSPASVEARVAPVLVDLDFPARRWQVLTVADLYGVDTTTRSLLEQLPERRYHSLAEVAGVLAAVLAGRPVASPRPTTPPPPMVRGRIVMPGPAVPPERAQRPAPSSPTSPAA